MLAPRYIGRPQNFVRRSLWMRTCLTYFVSGSGAMGGIDCSSLLAARPVLDLEPRLLALVGGQDQEQAAVQRLLREVRPQAYDEPRGGRVGGADAEGDREQRERGQRGGGTGSRSHEDLRVEADH